MMILALIIAFGVLPYVYDSISRLLGYSLLGQSLCFYYHIVSFRLAKFTVQLVGNI